MVSNWRCTRTGGTQTEKILWLFQMYPALELSGPLPSGSFLTCSNDNTMRVWNLYPHATLSGTTYEPNVYSNELLDIVYIDTEHLVDKESAKQQQQQQGSGFALNSIHSGSYAVLPTESGQQDEYKAGLRCLALTDTGTHIAAGDLMGNVRIYDAAMLHKGRHNYPIKKKNLTVKGVIRQFFVIN